MSSKTVKEKDNSWSIFNKIIKYRYLIALVIFIILVMLKVNGSSIALWTNYIGGSDKTTIVVGKARPVRSDEWEVLTPNVLAQAKSNPPYQVVNPNVGASGENMLVSLGMPVRDIYDLSQPLNWGYLLFGSEYGLSWYWNGKILLILLLSFELCMIITRQNKFASSLGAFWLALSPAVQWWLAQHVGNVLLYMEAMIVTFYYFFRYQDKMRAKTIFAILFALSCVGYVFPLYPPLQVTFGYLALIIMAIIYTDFRKKIKFNKSDKYIIIGTGIFIILMLFHAYLISKGALSALSNTAYPGKRVSSGGGAPNYAFYSFLTNLFLPYKDVTVSNTNNSEISSLLNFLPAVILALPFLIGKKSANLKFGIPIVLYSLLLAFYMYFQIPVHIAEATFFSYVTPGRAMLTYALSAALASIWALAEFSGLPVVKRNNSIVVSILVGISYFICVKYTELNQYVAFQYYAFFILILMILNYWLLRGKKRQFAVVMLGVILLSGATVNPINIGTGAIYNLDLSKEIQAVHQKDPGAVWIPDTNDAGAIGALIYANGAKSLGGINSIPEKSAWSAIDPNGKYETIYNRDAHISFQIVNSPTNFKLEAAGNFIVNINVNDLQKLKVKYVVSSEDLVSDDDANVTFTQIYPPTAVGYKIYSVSYR